MSFVSCETPWKPATIAIAPASRAVRMRPGLTSMIRALPWDASVITPAWLPVNDRASRPRLPIAIASNAMEMRPPAVKSMSSSRPGGGGVTCSARSSNSSVVSPIADTTTTTSCPSRRVSTIRCATRLIESASATDDPPYFCTTSPTVPEYRHDSMGAVGFSPRSASSALVAAFVLGGISACSSGGSAGPTPTPSPTPSAATQLQALATSGLQQSYTAAYSLRSTQPAGGARYTVGRTPTAYRINVQRGSSV